MSKAGSTAVVIALATLAGSATPAAAGGGQAGGSGGVRVGRFTAARTCTTYVLTSGKVGAASRSTTAAATDGVDAAYASRDDHVTTAAWRQDLVRDCQNNFPGLRASIERALAAGAAAMPAGRYTLNGRLSSVAVDGQELKAADYHMTDERITVTIEYDLRSPGGGSAAAGLITKHLSVGGGFATDGYERSSGSNNGYIELQREVALSVARAALFRIAPLRVVAVEGNRIRLNYGSGLLPPGSIIMVDAGMSSIRFLVASSSPTSVIAEMRGSGNPSRIAPDTIATFIEADDPAANTTPFERVGLP